MARIRESCTRIINKTSHWPLKDRRAHLIAVLSTEKQWHRRRVLSAALRDLTTRVIKQEMRGHT